MRAVVDTGVLVSALIHRQGTTGAVLLALRDGKFNIIYTTDLLLEIVVILSREKFHDKYNIQPDDISALINLIRLRGELVIPRQSVNACRDPKDNKFLEAALVGAADCIVSGDGDLLDMVNFQGIPILTPAVFISRL